MDTLPICPSCGQPLAANAPKGLCPECLMKGAFPTGTEAGPAPAGRGHFLPPKPEELARHFPQLELLGFIGQGGMGAVYQARQKQLDRIVALKILPPETAVGPGFAGRFAREARALAKLNHPHIVTLYEFGQTDGMFYFLMEYMDGLTLRQLLNLGRLAPAQALALVPQICDALQFAHNRGIVHRDIKPENLLMNKDGVVKIADFGVAKIIEPEPGPALRGDAENPGPAVPGTGAGGSGPALPPNVTGVIGTPNYMAPEQLEHPGAVDHRADIYSLGVVIYQMLTGELPGQSLEPPSKKVQLDVRLDEVVLRALEKNPELRYQQVSALKTEVETILTHPQKTNTSKTTRKPMNSKNSVLIVMVALLIAAGAAFTGMTLIKPAPLRPAGVVAAWSGDGKDAVGNNTATLTDVAVASGKVGRAFSFNGKSSWIRMPASPSLDIGAGDGFTIECWIKPNAFDVNVSGAPIIEWDSATSDGLQLWSGGTVFANLKDIHDVAHNMNILITLKTNQFQHVALTYDKPSGDARFYYNGLLLTNVNFGSLTPQTTYPVNIGRRTGQPIGNGDTFGGLMDGLSLYNRALSPEEIHKIYNKSAGWFGWL